MSKKQAKDLAIDLIIIFFGFFAIFCFSVAVSPYMKANSPLNYLFI